MKRILVVEDEPQILHFLQRGLTYEGFDVVLANNGKELLTKVSDSTPDLVLLDLMLPDMNVFDVCRHLRHKGNVRLPILMLTARDEVTDKITGLECGADDYITKPFDFEELVARIRATLCLVKNTTMMQRIEIGNVRINTATRQVWRGERTLGLTKREYDLLLLLVQHRGQVLTKGQIFEHVWGYQSETGLEVIKVYINYLRVKLNEIGEDDLIHAVRGIGYTLRF